MSFYKNQERAEAEDAELERLEAEYRKEFGEDQEPKVQEEVSLSPEEEQEEKTWKKRHADLRSYTQRQINDLQKQVSDLTKVKEDLEKAKSDGSMPASKQEAEEWVKEYPDLARIISALIDERSETKISSVADEVRDAKTQLEAERLAMARERALTKVLEVHSDFLDLINTDDFKSWVEDQPRKRGRIGQALYDALYNNETDASSAIEAVNVYKEDKGIEKKKSRAALDAATAVKKTSAVEAPSDGLKNSFKESEIEKMKPWEYEKLEDEIEKARREGRIVYDISGAAR